MLAAITRSYRPLLDQLDQLAAKDQGLKKKRIWRGHKDNTAALDRYHRELQFQTQTINLYLSLFSPPKNPDKAFHEDLGRGGREISTTAPVYVQGTELDVQWMWLKRRLVEDGITDIDIEAHTSSIRALLQERLPSYYDIHYGPSVEQRDGSGQASAGSRGILPRTTSEPDHRASTTIRNDAQTDLGHSTQAAGPAMLSSFSTAQVRNKVTHAPSQAEDDERRLSEKYRHAEPAHAPRSSGGERKHSAFLLDSANSSKQCSMLLIGAYFLTLMHLSS
jgi:hypothetical protein